MHPFDFSDTTYVLNGVVPEEIIGRRTGQDQLSVFDKQTDPTYNEVRVIATMPAYDPNGNVSFWYPLGDLQNTGFSDDKLGAIARETALLFPIYLFTDPRVLDTYSFSSLRQASLIDNSWAVYGPRNLNPLGIRAIFIVNYTEKAFGKDGIEMMNYFGKKNGFACDDTPLIKSLEDIRYLAGEEFITLQQLGDTFILPSKAKFAISPLIKDPTKSVIAEDAFLWMATKDGVPMEGEQMFVSQFNCLKKSGEWCQ